MRQLIILIFAASFFACQSGNDQTVPGSFDLTGFETEKLKGTDVIYAVRKDVNGQKLEEGYLMNGLKEGQWITYDEARGTMKSIQSYMGGQLTGYSFNVSIRGDLEEQIGYQNNQLNGSHFKLRAGKPYFEASYKDGVLHGMQREYYDRGQLRQETEFKDGEQHGIYKYYAEDGTVLLSYTYKNGKKVEGGIVENSEAAN